MASRKTGKVAWKKDRSPTRSVFRPPVETCDAKNASKEVMTLQRFLGLTADVPATSLRAAMAKAIAQEPPSRSYQRFYCRVLCKLAIQACKGELAA